MASAPYASGATPTAAAMPTTIIRPSQPRRAPVDAGRQAAAHPVAEVEVPETDGGDHGEDEGRIHPGGKADLGEEYVLGRLEQRRHHPVGAPVVRMPGRERGEQHRLDRGEEQDARQVPQPERGQHAGDEQPDDQGRERRHPAAHPLPIHIAIRPSPR